MKLQILHRSTEKKKEAKRLRREGFIPAVLYRQGTACSAVSIQSDEFAAAIRHVQPGHLSTTIFTLFSEDKKEIRAIIKDIQYNVTSYAPIHIDFEELLDDIMVNISVPIECVGVSDCVGIKLGGVLRQNIRSVKVRCLPKNIPNAFKIDVSGLQQGQSKRLADLNIPEPIRPLGNLNEVAVAIKGR